MGLFDTLKVMKDIVSGGIEAFKAGEKLDELIEKAAGDYDDVFTAENKSLYRKYEKSKKTYDDNSNPDRNDELLVKMEDDRIAFLESLQNNSSVPKSFRNEIKSAIENFKTADNSALDSLGEVLEKNTDSASDKAEIRKIINEYRRK